MITINQIMLLLICRIVRYRNDIKSFLLELNSNDDNAAVDVGFLLYFHTLCTEHYSIYCT